MLFYSFTFFFIFTLFTNLLSLKIYKNCIDVIWNGKIKFGNFIIQPIENGKTANVYCNLTGFYVETTIFHDGVPHLNITHHEHTFSPKYGEFLNEDMLEFMNQVNYNCSQSFEYRDAYRNFGKRKFLFWDNETFNFNNAKRDGICRCLARDVCLESQNNTTNCNSSILPFLYSKDSGDFSVKKERLPLRNIYIRFNSANYHSFRYTLGNLICTQMITPKISLSFKESPFNCQLFKWEKIFDSNKNTCIEFTQQPVIIDVQFPQNITKLSITIENSNCTDWYIFSHISPSRIICPMTKPCSFSCIDTTSSLGLVSFLNKNMSICEIMVNYV